MLHGQVERLEQELQRKAAEVQAEQQQASSSSSRTLDRTRSSTVTRTSSSNLPPPGSPSLSTSSPTTSSSNSDGALRVELAKLQVQVKSLEEGEERHKQRIQGLLKELAQERELKDEANRQTETKQETIDMCATEMERLESEKKELQEQLDVKQTSIELLSEQLEKMTKLCELRDERIEALTREMAAKSVMHKEMLEKLGGDLGKELQKSETAHLDTKRQMEEVKTALARTEAELVASKAEHANALEQHRLALEFKAKELATAQQRFNREVEKLEQGVRAIESGRGRLEQLKEIHEDMDRKEKAWAQEKESLEAKIATLSAENEALAESNAQLAEVLETAGESAGQAVSTELETRDWAVRVKQLEEQTMRQLEVIEVQESTKEALEKEKEALTKQLGLTKESLLEALANLEAARQESSAKGDAVSSTRKAVDQAKHEAKLREDAHNKKRAELEGTLGEVTTERNELRVKRAELEQKVANLERDAKSFKESTEEKIAELEGDRASLKERLNEAIQERWSIEEQLRKMDKEGTGEIGGEGAPGGGLRSQLATAEARVLDLEMRLKDVTRKLQDAEGETKRAKLEAQESKAKLGDQIMRYKSLEAENAKLTEGLKILTSQVIQLEEEGRDEEMEQDLAAAEELVDELEAKNAELEAKLAAAGGGQGGAAADANVVARCAELEAQLNKEQSNVAKLREEHSAAASLVTVLEQKVKALSGALDAATSQAPAGPDPVLTARCVELEAQVSKSTAEATRLTGERDAAASSVATLEDKIKELDAALEAAKAQAASASSASASSEEVERLKAELEHSKAMGESLARAQADLAAFQEAHKTAAEAHASEIAALNAQLAAATPAPEGVDAAVVEQLKAALASKEARVQELETQASSKQGEGEARIKALEDEVAASKALVVELEQRVAASQATPAVDSEAVSKLQAELADVTRQLDEARSASVPAAESNEENPYVSQLESQLSDAKLNLLAAQENHEEVKKELTVALEKAERLDQVLERSEKMEAFLNELQEERNSLFEKLETAEGQVAALGQLLGQKSSSAGPSEEELAARKVLQDEVENLKTQVARRDEELERQAATLQSLIKAAESRGTHASEAGGEAAAAAVPSSSDSAGTSDAAPTPGSGAPTGGTVAPEVLSRYEFCQWDAALLTAFVSMNTKRMEAAKERQSFNDKKVFKDPNLAVVTQGGQVLFLKVGGAPVATCAVIKTGGEMYIRYIAFADGTSAEQEAELLGVLVHHAYEFSKGNKAEQLVALFSGAMTDAEKKWGGHGFRVAGVGPGPDYAVKLTRLIE